MHRRLIVSVLAGLSVALSACSPASPTTASNPAASSSQPRTPRILVHPTRNEPDSVTQVGAAGTDNDHSRYFHAALTIIDQNGEFVPQLAESLPQLNTSTWTVAPDGKMTTTYKLKPNLVWHDGHPIVGADWVLGLNIAKCSACERGTANTAPTNIMSGITAPDDRTVVIEWAQPYVRAGALLANYVPRPAHLLTDAYDKAMGGDVGALDGHPYWHDQFVHAGPYRLTAWTPGVAIEGEAFDRYVLGKPKIEKVRVTFMNDPNALVANLLAGNITLVAGVNFRSTQGISLEQQWAGNQGGKVIFVFDGTRFGELQFKPEYAYPNMLNKTVRQAIASSVDREGLVLGLHDGRSEPAYHFGPKGTPLFDKVDKAAKKWPYDGREVERLLTSVGYVRGADGIFTHPTDGPLKVEFRATEGGDSAQEVSILRDGARKVGIPAEQYIIPRAQANDREVRSTFPSVSSTSNTGFPEEWYRDRRTDNIASASNRWTGQRGGWSNAEYDRLEPLMKTTLDREQREGIIVQIAQLVADEVPLLPLYQNVEAKAHTADLTYPWLVAPDGTVGWNVHEWDMR
jgi:peptide/nickel transport system substrate-binding protein